MTDTRGDDEEREMEIDAEVERLRAENDRLQSETTAECTGAHAPPAPGRKTPFSPSGSSRRLSAQRRRGRRLR